MSKVIKFPVNKDIVKPPRSFDLPSEVYVDVPLVRDVINRLLPINTLEDDTIIIALIMLVNQISLSEIPEKL